jgi:hypothetical protein
MEMAPSISVYSNGFHKAISQPNSTYEPILHFL